MAMGSLSIVRPGGTTSISTTWLPQGGLAVLGGGRGGEQSGRGLQGVPQLYLATDQMGVAQGCC